MLQSTAQHIYYNTAISLRQCIFAPSQKILSSARKVHLTLVEHSVLQKEVSSTIIKVQRGTQITGILKKSGSQIYRKRGYTDAGTQQRNEVTPDGYSD